MDDKDKAQLEYDMNNTVRFTVVGGKYQEFATQYPNFPFFSLKDCALHAIHRCRAQSRFY